jgi:DNA-binding MarR family transcriptional regulator
MTHCPVPDGTRFGGSRLHPPSKLPPRDGPFIIDPVPAELPLSALLSQLLVAFTVEFDNEFEHQMPHRTTGTVQSNPPGGGVARVKAPWLVSQVMWSNVLQFVGEEGISLPEMHARARTTRDSLSGLQRWGYVGVGPTRQFPDPPTSDMIVRPTDRGRAAQDVWRPLAGVIEGRWRARFGDEQVRQLRGSLQAIIGQFDFDLPQYLPVVFPAQGGRAEVPGPSQLRPAGKYNGVSDDISVLLSRVLLGFTIDFERQSRISLPISATGLRVLDQTGVRLRDLPRLTGVSKEGNSMVIGFLARHGCVVVEPIPTASRGKWVRLSPKGQRALDKYRRVLAATEASWRTRFGEDLISELHVSLRRVVGGPTIGIPSAFRPGLQPYPDGWRATVDAPEELPHYPMILHRGGYPDGS